jgi:FPC/CPF motif-containing protein YcgG
VLYAFADTVDEAPDVAHIGEAIVGYLHGLTHLPQAEADTTVLVILIKPPPAARSLSDYAKDAGVLLSALHHRDEAPWPAGLPTDPDDPKWSYAFAGQALFINVSTPANIVRRSRNVGPGMALIVSPRDVFDRVAGPDEKGRKTRSTIRERTAAYDGGLPFASWSAVRYGEGSTGTERKQYVLAEDNENPIDLVLTPKPVGVCPFRRGSS